MPLKRTAVRKPQPAHDTTPCPVCGIPRCYPPEADCPNDRWHTFPQPERRPETEAEVEAVRAQLERLPGYGPLRFY